MEILSRYDAEILDIGQADIHSSLNLGILVRIDDTVSGSMMKDLLFKTTELGVNIGFAPVDDSCYEDDGWRIRQEAGAKGSVLAHGGADLTFPK
jgi:phosphoserine phosphatase